MAAQTFFGNRVAIYLSDGSSVASGDLVLVAQDFSASAEYSNEDLYGTGSIVRQDVARHSMKATFSFKCFKVDLTDDMFKYMIDGDVASPSGKIAVGTNDSSFPKKFYAEVYLDKDSASGSASGCKLTDIVFDKFPLSGDDKSWIGFEFSGTASGFELITGGSLPT